MSKRQNPPPPGPPTKRSRKMAGFRLARPQPSISQPPSASSSSLFVTVSTDSRRRGVTSESRLLPSSTLEASEPASDSTAQPCSDPAAAGGDFETHTVSPEDVGGTPSPESTAKAKRKRYTTNTDRLTEWLKFRETFLDEVLRHDGLGDFLGHTSCSRCGKTDGIIKCKDCGDGCMLKCSDCTVDTHRRHPLHRVERWNGTFFDKVSLQSVGLCYQLGHSGAPCPCPQPGPKNFLIFDISGPHYVTINYCHCKDEPSSNWVQLLRERWFPATLQRPQTVFTFQCLETYHELTLQGKTNLYDYYHTLLRLSDSANLSAPVYRYSEIHRVFRMWRNLMALKRAGRGHDPDGVSGTSQGGLMVECPACPHPERNLPDGWERAGPLLFLYALFIAVDGNFKLKGKERNLKDVELMPGWGAYVPEDKYKKHLENYVDEPEINTCESQHDALVRASTRSTAGYAVSGAVLVICSRHCLIRKNGAGDLKKGERYCTVDFILFSVLMGITLLRVVITYDIICQWSKNFRKRMQNYPENMRIPETTQVEVAIPGWHINGHGEGCRTNFNLNYMEGAGRTVGEDIETTWAGTNQLAPSVREMGPAARHDTLNDQWNGWNFRKIVGFRTLFLKRFKDAFTFSAQQADVFNQFSATFSPSAVKKWEEMVVVWNANPKARNPYQDRPSGTTLQDIRLVLVREEAAQAALGQLPRHKVSLSSFLLIGFDLEDSQYLLRREANKMKGLRTSKQLADLQNKRNALYRLIQNWREVQLVYIPHVASLLSQAQPPPEATSTSSSTPLAPETLAENLPLFLPSSLPPRIRALPELREICKLEQRLRRPQADDALADVRRQRRITQGLWLFKRLNVSGTGNRPNTRMISLYKRFNDKTDRAAEKYRFAWRALSALDPGGSWSLQLHELKPKDVSGPGRDPDETKSTNSRYQPSWIWLAQRANPHNSSELEIGEDEFNESMRVEWAKARARMKRWKEELMLVQEEMRRVITYHKWRADWWRERGVRRNHDDPKVSSGISSYAYKQADICERLAERCAVHWLPHLKVRGINPSWASDYEHMLSDVPVPLHNADVDVSVPSDHPDDDDLEDDELDCEDRDEEIEVDEADCFNLDDIDY